MEANEVKALLEALLEKTRAKQADWQKSSRENEFVLRLNSGTVSIDSQDDRFTSIFEITIFNKRGDVIFTSTVSDNNPLHVAIGELHERARACYFKTDETIKGLISELGLPGVIGTPVAKPKAENLDEDVPF